MQYPEVDSLISKFEEEKSFNPCVLNVDAGNIANWVRLKKDPVRFIPKIFDGDWAFTHLHPTTGEIRLVRIIEGTDGVCRAIGRQGKHIYAYPWFR